MDYTLRVITSNAEFYSHGCATLTDVSNQMHSIMRSQFSVDLDRGAVTFVILDNTKKER